MAPLTGKGIGGQVDVDGQWVTISRKGVLAKTTHGFFKGDKRIPIRSISAVQFKKAGGLTNGYIQFSLPGGNESTKGIVDATKDENSVFFTKKDQPEFEAIRDYIERAVAGQTTTGMSQAAAPADVADQIKKLAELRDQGILSEEEFQGQKAKLL